MACWVRSSWLASLDIDRGTCFKHIKDSKERYLGQKHNLQIVGSCFGTLEVILLSDLLFGEGEESCNILFGGRDDSCNIKYYSLVTVFCLMKAKKVPILSLVKVRIAVIVLLGDSE